MMNALRLVYLQYWLKFSCEETFTVHLVILKGLIVSPRSLDQTKHGSFQLLMCTFQIRNVIFWKWLWGLMCNGLWTSPWIWIFCPIFGKNNLLMHNLCDAPQAPWWIQLRAQRWRQRKEKELRHTPWLIPL